VFSRQLFPELVRHEYFLEEAIDLSYTRDPSLMPSTIRNQLKGKVKSIVSDKVLSEVSVETAAGVVASVITTASLKALKLKKGDTVSILVKATNVSIAKD
jgi:molybdopterin-binding protein